jgi:hypothetical protein
MHPQELEETVLEEEATIRRSLPRMSVWRALDEAGVDEQL